VCKTHFLTEQIKHEILKHPNNLLIL